MSRLVRQVHTIVCLYLLLYCTGAFVAPAQEFRGSLLATILDSTGSRIPGADVSLTQDKFGVAREAKSNTRGEARFEALQPGTYTVTTRAVGFMEKTPPAVVPVATHPPPAITLNPQTVRETVRAPTPVPALPPHPLTS